MRELPDWGPEDGGDQSARSREELEEHLQRRTAELRSLVDATSGTVLRLDADGTIEFVDESVESLLGVEPPHLVGESVATLLADGETAGIILGETSPSDLIASLADEESTMPLPMTTADGRMKQVSLNATSLADQDAYLCVIEESHEEEGPTAGSGQRRDLVDAVGDPLYVLDATGAIERVNDAMVAYTGYERDELVGRTIGEILPSPEYNRTTNRLASLAAEGANSLDTFETTLVTKDGELIHSEAKVSVLTDDDGEYAGSVGVLRDIRGRKQRERDLELLKQVLTRVFRHNVRNDLTIVQTNAELLDRQTDADTDEYTDAILSTCERLLAHSEKARLMEQVIDTDQQEKIDISQTVAELVASARKTAPNATIETDLTAPTYVEAHPDIGKAIEELIENALTHAPDDQEPTVRIWADETETFRTLFIEDESGGLADDEIEVLRRGEESDLEHGSGVGLWLVRWLVDHSGAKMIAHRTEQGSLMGIRFPRHDTEAASTATRLDDETPFTRAPAQVRDLSLERFHGETVVGRMEELHRLEDIYDAITRTGGHAVLVTGEMGVGKTTLVNQFQRRLTESEDAPLLAGGTCESTMTRPYHALREALADLPVETELEETLAGMVPARSDDPETVKQRKQALFTDVAETLRDLAMDHPVVLVIEDLQWADPGTVDLLRYLIEEVGRWALPIMFLGTYRTDEIDETHPIVEITEQTVETGRGTVLELDPFDPVDVRNLLAYMLDVEDVPESFVATVQNHTGGTPLFVAEIGRQLAETLGPSPDQTELPDNLDAVTLPESVDNAVTERIDALYDPVQSVLELGAVVGETISFDVLREASERTEAELVEYVDRLVHKHLWERTDGKLTFVHGIVREKVLESIDEERTRTLNERVARAIERVNADTLEEQYGRLAALYDEASEHTQAIEYYRRAGERAADAYAHEDAVEFYERAIALASEHSTDAGLLAGLHADLADVFRTVGDLDRARETGQDGISVAADESQSLCRLLGIVADVQTAQGDFEQASETTERQRALAAKLDSKALEAEAVRRLGVIDKNRGAFDQAREHYETALALAEGDDDREFVATVRKEMGVVAWRQGEYEQASESFEESLTIAQKLDARPLESACLNNLGGVASQQGEYEQAREYHEQSLEISQNIDDSKGESYSRNNIGEVLAHQGKYDKAREYYEESLEIKREIGNSRGQSETLLNLGVAARHQGEYEQAREYHEEGLAIARDIGERLREAGNLANIGDIDCQRGEYEQARDCFEESLAIARELNNPVEQIHALRGLGVVARATGHHEQAESSFADALAIGDETEHPAEIARTHLESARLALATGDHDTARERVATARETFETLGATFWLGRCRRLQGQIAAVEGDRATALAHWEAALDTFESTGAPQDTLTTLERLVDHCREHGTEDEAREWWHQARQRLADAPDAVVTQHEDWVDRQGDELDTS